MTDISKQVAEKLFDEINQNMALAEEYWIKEDTKFVSHFPIAKEKLRESEKMFEE